MPRNPVWTAQQTVPVGDYHVDDLTATRSGVATVKKIRTSRIAGIATSMAISPVTRALAKQAHLRSMPQSAETRSPPAMKRMNRMVPRIANDTSPAGNVEDAQRASGHPVRDILRGNSGMRMFFNRIC